MDKDAMTIQWMDRIIEAIDAFRWSGVPDDVIQFVGYFYFHKLFLCPNPQDSNYPPHLQFPCDLPFHDNLADLPEFDFFHYICMFNQLGKITANLWI